MAIAPHYMEHPVPYIDIEWLGPGFLISELESNSSQIVREVIDSENLTSSISFLSPTASVNGKYSCQITLKLPRVILNIGESNPVEFLLEGMSSSSYN